MPTMMEIYQRYSSEYDELVAHEDVQNNLGVWLAENVKWKDKVVFEAGVGTGRVTSLYIERVKKAYLFDRSSHMLSTLQINLSRYAHKIITAASDHLDISLEEKADIFIEGWSFGHIVIENGKSAEAVIDQLEKMICRNLRKGGTSIIIETMGTNVAAPNPPEELLALYYRKLEDQYGYKKEIVRTDYHFATVEEAGRIMGFFFGEKMSQKILQERTADIQEFTGIWVR